MALLNRYHSAHDNLFKRAVQAQVRYLLNYSTEFHSCTSRPDVCQFLVVQTTMDKMSKNKSSTSLTHVACESMLRSVVRSSIHPCLRNCAAIRCAVVYYAWGAQSFSAGIKWWHSSTVHGCQKQSDNFDEILQAKAKLGKYLMKKCLLEYCLQLSFNYFIKSSNSILVHLPQDKTIFKMISCAFAKTGFFFVSLFLIRKRIDISLKRPHVCSKILTIKKPMDMATKKLRHKRIIWLFSESSRSQFFTICFFVGFDHG